MEISKFGSFRVERLVISYYLRGGGCEIYMILILSCVVNNYIVRSDRDVIVVTNTSTRRTNKT